MRLKKILFMMLVAVISIFGITSVNAATISEDGKYSLLLTSDSDEWDGCFDGEYSELIRFNIADGETTVKLSELTKGVNPFNGKNEFSHWVNKNNEKVDKDLSIADFTVSGNFYKSTGEEVNYTNGLVLVAKFEGKALNETDNYYITFDAFGGTINGKAKILLSGKLSEFTTIDLTKYTPIRKGYTFKGWDLDGKIVTSIDSSTFTNAAVASLTATYTKDTFEGDDRVLILNANGGTISGNTSSKYDYLGGGNSGTSMSLLPYIPERKGYTFNGWNSKKDGSGKNYTYIYWRLWDDDGKTEVEKDTIIENSLGAKYYQNVTLYASWTKISDTEEKVKEIKSDGDIKSSITFEEEVDSNYTLDIKEVEVKKELADKNVKYIVDINVLEDGEVIKINGTKMIIRIALPENLKGYKNYKVVYISNGEIKETIPASVEDGYMTFETSHGREYGIIATEKANVVNPKTGDNIILYMILGIISTISIVVLNIKRKEVNE